MRKPNYNLMVQLNFFFLGSSYVLIRSGTSQFKRWSKQYVSVGNNSWDIFSQHVSYATQTLKPWGWRLSLGSAAFPALLMTLGGYFLPETPTSLIERGLTERGRQVLEKLRGTRDVNTEFQDMVHASVLSNSIKHPFKEILNIRHRPQLVMAILLPTFQILTGVNCVLFYAPVLFITMGFGGNALLYSSVLVGAVLVLSTLISIALVDRLGRRALLISGGLQMTICQVKMLPPYGYYR